MIQIVREKSNNNIIRRKKIKLKKNTRFKGSNISEDKYKYMEGYNFLFFFFFRGNRANGRNSEKRIDGGMIREI